MKYLLDTHALIWFFSGNAKLSKQARLLMENENIIKLISLTSVWEMGIKQSKGKFALAVPLDKYIQDKLDLEDYEMLPITLKQLTKISTLPFHHNDPFDRLLIAQAMTEQIPLISKDTAFDPYEIEVIWH